jgi:hypothetical protein
VKKAGPYPTQDTAITFCEENLTSDVEWMVTRVEEYTQLLPDFSLPVDDGHIPGDNNCDCDSCEEKRY